MILPQLKFDALLNSSLFLCDCELEGDILKVGLLFHKPQYTRTLAGSTADVFKPKQAAGIKITVQLPYDLTESGCYVGEPDLIGKPMPVNLKVINIYDPATLEN